MTVKLAVIGGTGVYDPKILDNIELKNIDTPYGQVAVKIGEYKSKKVAFLPRHGEGHTIPPHQINYRANIAALKALGVEKIIATAAVGSLNEAMGPGSLVLFDQFIDFTKSRVGTFFEGEKGVLHVDFTDPYCSEVRQVVKQAAEVLNLPVILGGTYVCTEGPRFETPAEIKMFKIWGGDLVGMTSVPEVVLAKEAAMCYASVAMVTNFAAGISPNNLTHGEVVECMTENSENIKKLIMQTIEIMTDDRDCLCKHAEDELGSF
jgi:5'-methylthioadenosine phosphorylase